MLAETIKQRLTERFAAPLPEFHTRRIVFWRDEDGEFADGVDELDLPKVTVVKLTGTNNFAVKKRLSTDDVTSDYLVYDPLSYAKDQHDDWLLNIKLYSEEFRADLVSLQMEELQVEPSSVMRKTMKMYAKFLDNKDRKAKLRRMGRKYQTPLQLHIDIMAILCGSTSGTAQDVIIAVLSSGLETERNEALINVEKFGNIKALWELVQKYTGYVHNEDRPLEEFATHILITALSHTMPVSVLRGLEQFISESNKTYCYQLVHEWQQRKDCKILEKLCHDVAHKVRLAARFDKIDIQLLLKSDIFPEINESILKRYYKEISEQVIKVAEILTVVENRRTAAWYPLTKDYIESLYYIAKVNEFNFLHRDDFHLVDPVKVWKRYTTDLYKMDSHYRHFHYHFSKTLNYQNPLLEDALNECADVVEGLYRERFLQMLTQTWTNAIARDLDALGCVSNIKEQRCFYNDYVSPITNKGHRVFVIISDALRYEVAAELAEKLRQDTSGTAQLDAVQALFPSITKFGMAALLPGKELTVNNRMEVFVNGNPTKTTDDRVKILKDTNTNSVAVCYTALREMKKQARRDLVAGKEIIYIYHNIIDAIGDKSTTETKVFEACEDAITELTNIVKIICNDLSGTNVFITADHGFLYTYQALEESQKISRDTLDGDILEHGRRYALVSPSTTASYLLPVNTAQTIGGKPMKGYAPQDIVRIKKQGGGENYVHGGISMQEMVVPVIVYKGLRPNSKKYVETQSPGLILISESRKVYNLMFSLEFLQKHPVGDKVQSCKYTLYFSDDLGRRISDSQTVIADKTSHSASDRVFRVRFTLKQQQYNKNKHYRLVITNETDAPKEVDFCMDIAFADDFGFDL